MDTEFAHMLLLMALLTGFAFMLVSRLLLVWLSRRSGEEKFSALAALGYSWVNTPGEASRALRAYQAAYKADPRSVIGLIAGANVALWLVMFTSMLAYAIKEIAVMVMEIMAM